MPAVPADLVQVRTSTLVYHGRIAVWVTVSRSALTLLALPVLTGLLLRAAVAQDGPVPGQPFLRHTATDVHGRVISFYIAEPTGPDLPLLVYVQPR